ncbi:DEAD/DEAH box helicase [Thalassospira xianhensis]|uniref:DNA2/NAM7 helicase-like C-terminal domain-containing protein n=1 Tax=Thalassospira xianhensis MCCC 1A02616 TaxID=1177929 RepID=A0A367UHU5_9PROT|nr:DEAD/DEAH box helicase [Thalassospira xianhensis]RCK07590.1 hypothetical protein TH5_00475 [Thalassospira xianhensis MCCC 1A02616]
MPVLGKAAMSRFLKTGCDKLAKFDLYPVKSCADERRALNMPMPDRERPAAAAAKRIGDEWEHQKLAEIEQTFGHERLLCGRDKSGQIAAARLNAPHMLNSAKAGDILAQAQFDVGNGSFARAHGLDNLKQERGLECQDAIPDILMVYPSGFYTHAVMPSGQTEELSEEDGRLQLRVIDIKVTEQPGANYFAEIAYYEMALAGWLLDRGYSRKFVVVPHGAVWPGTHEEPVLVQAFDNGLTDPERLFELMNNEFLEAPQSIFANRIRMFLQRDLVRLLDANWEDLDWHVDGSCRSCEYLGHNWFPNKKRSTAEVQARSQYCMPQANTIGHLSRVPFLPRGARKALEAHGVHSVSDLALAGEWANKPLRNVDDVTAQGISRAQFIFSDHRALNTKRSIVQARADALTTPGYRARVADDTKSSAAMPKWSGLKIYVTATFDISTAMTLSFGVSAFWSRGITMPRDAALVSPIKQPDAETYAVPPILDEEGNQIDGGLDIVETASHIDAQFAAARSENYMDEPAENWNHWPSTTFIVERDTLGTELKSFTAFLEHIDSIIRDPRVQGTDWSGGQPSSYQIYLWDSPTYEHLRRVVGRHLPELIAREDLEHLYNIFPANQQMRGEQLASKHSPFTIVKRVVEASVSAPIPHFYSLLNVARQFNTFADQSVAREMLKASPLFDDPLSDHIPSERAHEIWKQTSNWEIRYVQLEATIRKHLFALSQITERLERDMRHVLAGAAPSVPDLVGRIDQKDRQRQLFEQSECEEPELLLPGGQGNMSSDGALWLNFTSLGISMSSFEVDDVRSMTVSEREARGKSARLAYRLTDGDAERALARMGLEATIGRRVYQMEYSSREVSARKSEIDWAIAPGAAAGFLDRGVKSWFETHHHEIPKVLTKFRTAGAWRMQDLTSVSIAGLDRTRGLVVLDAHAVTGDECALDILEQTGACELSNEVVLDPVHVDMFLNKLDRALGFIGNPQIARQYPIAQRLLEGRQPPLNFPTDDCKPVAELLWKAKAMERRGTTNARHLLSMLADRGITLNSAQREAFINAVERRVHLIWGPPGTGKSHTIGAIILGYVLETIRRGSRLRILVTAATWTAIDNILADIPKRINLVTKEQDVMISRLRSPSSRPPSDECARFDMPLNRHDPSHAVRQLKERLTQWTASAADLSNLELTVTGATAHQVSNLMGFCGKASERGLFDLIIIDEGSQMDVPTAAVSLASLARNGTVLCAGDWLQLAPIQTAPSPEGLEAMLGSIYEFLMRVHGIEQTLLNVNHRSNADIVGFFRQAGYEQLSSHSPEMRIRMQGELPRDVPGWWPEEQLPWSSNWADILDPATSLVSIVHEDDRSNQSSLFEAQCIASMVLLLSRHLKVGLSGRMGHDGRPVTPEADRNYSECTERFWKEAIGIVTPHRAQQGLVIAEIQKHFDDRFHDMIREAVDTVERFQGQERDIMICSFAMADPDAIADEEEFLYSLNRFNVMASRARAKFIAIMSSPLVEHLGREVKVLEQSRLLKLFAETPMENRRDIKLPWRDHDGVHMSTASFRWHDHTIQNVSLPTRKKVEHPTSGTVADAILEEEVIPPHIELPADTAFEKLADDVFDIF